VTRTSPGARAALTDGLLATALLALGLAEHAFADLGHSPGEVAVTVLATAPLALRRRYPSAVLAATLVALSVLSVQGSDSFSVAQLLGLMLATYTVANREPPLRAGVGLGAALAAAYVNSAAAPGEAVGDHVFATILLTVPWLAGWALRRWRERAAELERLTAQLSAERQRHARLVVAAERGRIARDLHDSLAQTLNAVVVHAEAADAARGHDEEQVGRSLERIRQVSRDALQEMRLLLGQLRGDASGVDGLPRLGDLERLVAEARSQGLTVEVEHRGEPRPLGAGVDAAAYRILQESLTNAARHAPGSTVRVCVSFGDDLRLSVRSSMVPAPTAARRSGYGLLGMRERAALVGGELTTGPDGGDFLVTARLPVERAS
jgi:signal transduction histidine kinase